MKLNQNSFMNIEFIKKKCVERLSVEIPISARVHSVTLTLESQIELVHTLHCHYKNTMFHVR